MVWFKVDDNLAFHQKVIQAGNAAMGLWVRAGAWASHQMSDGFVPQDIAAMLGTAPQAAKLVRSGLWDEVSGGFLFHEWSERNPDSASKKAALGAQQSGGAHGNHMRWHVKRQVSVPSCEFCASPTRSVGESSVPARPVPIKSTSTAARPDDPEGFAEFWSVYPRKEAKRAAAKAYRAALKRATAEDILKGAKRYAATRPEPRFTAMGATWLNADRWEDSPVSNNNAPSAPGAATRRTANGVTLDQW